MIYHITEKQTWEKAVQAGEYTCPSLVSEGFIHLCKEHQINGVKERYYQDKKDLLLLSVEEQKIKALVKYELSPTLNEYFPHSYGPLNLDAIVAVKLI